MTRLVLVMVSLCVLAAVGTAQAQEQRDVVIQVRVGADAARQLAGWEDGQYGSLLSGRLPGAFFTDGQAREPSLVRQSQTDLTSLSIGFADGTLHSTGDGVYDPTPYGPRTHSALSCGRPRSRTPSPPSPRGTCR